MSCVIIAVLVSSYKIKQHVQCTCNVTLRHVRATVVAVQNQLVIRILSVSVALGIQRAKRMPRIILSSVVCPALQYFPTLSHERRDFRQIVPPQLHLKHFSL